MDEERLGMRITPQGIEFIATGDAKTAQDRGVLIGELYAVEEITRQLYLDGLLSQAVADSIAKVRITLGCVK